MQDYVLSRCIIQVVETGLQELSRVNESISLVTAVGPYHSGKSFLLNIIRFDTTSRISHGILLICQVVHTP